MKNSKNKLKLSDLHYMKEALKLAEKALNLGEWPVGAVIVYNESVYSESSYNESHHKDTCNLKNSRTSIPNIITSKILAKAHNMVESFNDPTAHAELIAANEAFKILNRFRNINASTKGTNIKDSKNTRYLENCTLFVTLEPCKMCLYTLQTMRIGKIIYGAKATNSLNENQLTMFDTICEEEAQKLLFKHASMIRKKS